VQNVRCFLKRIGKRSPLGPDGATRRARPARLGRRACPEGFVRDSRAGSKRRVFVRRAGRCLRRANPRRAPILYPTTRRHEPRAGARGSSRMGALAPALSLVARWARRCREGNAGPVGGGRSGEPRAHSPTAARTLQNVDRKAAFHRCAKRITRRTRDSIAIAQRSRMRSRALCEESLPPSGFVQRALRLLHSLPSEPRDPPSAARQKFGPCLASRILGAT